jgi:hypothetical protein
MSSTSKQKILNNKKNQNRNKTNKNKNMTQSAITLDTMYNHLLKITTDIKNDTTDLKKRLDTHDFHFEKIEKRLTLLEKDRDVFYKYMKKDSNIQETGDILFISKLYLHNHPSDIILPISIDKFYNHKGKEITELDGFLLISNIPLMELSVSNELLHRHPNAAAFYSKLKSNRTNNRSNQLEYIIIESKHSLDKGKVDKKIRQLSEIYDVFSSASDQHLRINSKYKLMIEEIMKSTQLSIDKLDLPINLIFSSDDISDELIEYINSIYTGMNEETYDMLTLQLFELDPYIDIQLSIILKDNRITKLDKGILKRKESMQSIRDIFKKDILQVYITDNMETYLTPFLEMEELFMNVYRGIGISKQNSVLFERLFPKHTFNMNV